MDIRAVYFDFGGVLYLQPDRSWMKRWLRMLKLQHNSKFSALLNAPEESPYVQAVMEGRIPEAEFWQELGESWRLGPFLVRWMRRNSMSRKRMNREAAEFLRGLRPRCRTAILSNAGSEARQSFTDVFGFHKLVDEMIISAEIGIAKPDKRIYEIALDRLGVQAHQAIFVDDLAINVEAARGLGMHAVHFRDTRQGLAEVQALLG